MPKKSKPPNVIGLYYITHVDNLRSIFDRGILAHRRIEEAGLPFRRIYDADIVSSRATKTTPANKSLWEYANCYFQARNPMMYRVGHEINRSEIAVVQVSPQILQKPGAFVTNGNAASGATIFAPSPLGLQGIEWAAVFAEYWNPLDGSKRKIMAECLVPDRIEPDLLTTVFVGTPTAKEAVSKLGIDRPIIIEPQMFFLPRVRRMLTKSLSLAIGDMFFSEKQTLTVSVNVVGIMGKGLASRAKYQYPDVYVAYQDACRSKALRVGRPFLYKRESSTDEELADEPNSLKNPNATKWFLLFPTKRHWRENSELGMIADGLRWLVENWELEGIESIAMPALGCGLGKLSWEDVGPVMCKALANVNAAVYLPQEQTIPEEWLKPEFLLG